MNTEPLEQILHDIYQADALRDGNKPTEALELYLACVERLKEIDIVQAKDRDHLAYALHMAGVCANMLKNPSEAINFFTQAAEQYAKTDRNPIDLANLERDIGSNYLILEQYKEALECFNNSAMRLEKLHEYDGAAISYAKVGVVYTRQKNYEEASSVLEKARGMTSDNQLYPFVTVYLHTAELHLAQAQDAGESNLTPFSQSARQAAQTGIDAFTQHYEAYKKAYEAHQKGGTGEPLEDPIERFAARYTQLVAIYLNIALLYLAQAKQIGESDPNSHSQAALQAAQKAAREAAREAAQAGMDVLIAHGKTSDFEDLYQNLYEISQSNETRS